VGKGARPQGAVARASRGDFAHPTGVFWRDTDGLIFPYVTMMLIVIIGVAVLALDGARYMSLQTQLQNGADALALAGAAELDRLPDSETRAIRAINNLLRNQTSPGSGSGGAVEVSRINFFSELPSSDATDISRGTAATSPANARFVLVTVKPVSLRTILPASFFGGENSISAGASAVAGNDEVVCQTPPIFVCNPYETEDMDYDMASGALQEAMANPNIRRRLIRLRQHGDDFEPYAPGDYSFLSSPGVIPDQDTMVEAMGNARPATCFSRSGVNLHPMSVEEISDGLNVRFDIYQGRMSTFKNSSDFRPAVNVRKGYIGSEAGGGGEGGYCSARPATFWPMGDPPNRATALLFDREYPYLHGRMGSGRWDFSTYWQVNHGGAGRAPPYVNGAPASNSNLPSRYDVYRYEIDQDYVGDHSPGGETGAPACYGGGLLSDKPDRRILQAAIINCHSLGLRGAEQNVPVAAFGKFFITVPMQGATDIFTEAAGLVKPPDPLNFDMVQLYR
jgi:hypothetical protein